MDTDEIVLWVCLGVAVLLAMLFLVFAVSTGGIRVFALYILFPLFIISFLVGMVLLVQLIIKLNDKLDNDINGLNKKVDTNNYMIKDSIDNVDNYLQNVDYTVIVEDRNVPITAEEVDQLGAPFRYQPKLYQPSLEIPNVSKDIIVSGTFDSKDIIVSGIECSNEFILTENNIKSVEHLIPETIMSLELQENIDSLSTNESLNESLSINETLNDDSFSINESLNDSLSVGESLNEYQRLEYYELNVSEENTIENNDVILSEFYIPNLMVPNPLNEEFLNVYNLFEE